MLLVGLRCPSQVQVQIEASSKVSTEWCFSRLRPVMEKLLHSKSLSPAFHMFSGKVLKQWSNVTFACVFLFHWQKNIQILFVPPNCCSLTEKKHQHIACEREKKTSEISFFSGGAFAGLGHSPVFFSDASA